MDRRADLARFNRAQSERAAICDWADGRTGDEFASNGYREPGRADRAPGIYPCPVQRCQASFGVLAERDEHARAAHGWQPVVVAAALNAEEARHD